LRFATLPAGAVARWLAALAPLAGPSRPLTQLPLDPADLLAVIAAAPVAVELEAALGPSPWCNLSQSWLRHGRPPHSWHQDGALRHDFLAHAGRPAPADAALAMRTLWIALTPCGRDAPGLQWVDAAMPLLLQPAELADEAVAARFGPQHVQHAELAPGQALLFDGLLLHRTHLTPAMNRPRTSLELRFFRADALPARVAGDAGRRLPSNPAL
jgi:ectoine hydroxylase-related dioxygenase (phytanoyl-CoA dioxygenase family)